MPRDSVAPGILGRARPELLPHIRSVVCGSYVVFFQYQEKVLEVVHVAEGHRDLAALFDEPS
jgi:plasmid stabilization system protein ParE